ncbi:hypothetical protein LP419_03825 [Massilia sp. H-1]|nr:hypothetical protein LP419_03825 [Massilia sp. H-1]
MMLVSDDNRMAQIHLLGGRIIFILCRGRRGRDGLGIMRTMQRAHDARPSERGPERAARMVDRSHSRLPVRRRRCAARRRQPATLLPGIARRPTAMPAQASA